MLLSRIDTPEIRGLELVAGQQGITLPAAARLHLRRVDAADANVDHYGMARPDMGSARKVSPSMTSITVGFDRSRKRLASRRFGRSDGHADRRRGAVVKPISPKQKARKLLQMRKRRG
jgi:hypothetical protein